MRPTTGVTSFTPVLLTSMPGTSPHRPAAFPRREDCWNRKAYAELCGTPGQCLELAVESCDGFRMLVLNELNQVNSIHSAIVVVLVKQQNLPRSFLPTGFLKDIMPRPTYNLVSIPNHLRITGLSINTSEKEIPPLVKNLAFFPIGNKPTALKKGERHADRQKRISVLPGYLFGTKMPSSLFFLGMGCETGSSHAAGGARTGAVLHSCVFHSKCQMPREGWDWRKQWWGQKWEVPENNGLSSNTIA